MRKKPSRESTPLQPHTTTPTTPISVETSAGASLEHKVDELWRKLRRAISRGRDVKKVILDYEKAGTRRSHRSLLRFFSPSPPRETFGNEGDRLGISDRARLLQKRASEVVEALRLKHLGTGYNLFMHAVFERRTDSFDCLVEIVKQRLGRRGLVKQLRESDVHEAPLLFLAASSSCFECFTHVSDEILNTLGQGELRQQLLAKDLKGRTIIFHAACSQNVEVFEAVLRMIAAEKGERPGNESWLAEVSSPDQGGCTNIGRKRIVIDLEEKTVLHHACQTGSTAIVSRVIEEAKSYGDTFLRGFMHRSDYLGRTAVMHIFRSQREDDVSEKLKKLLELMTREETVVAMTQPTKSFFSTALGHAAYGGLRQFEIARKIILELAPGTRNASDELVLDAALGIGSISPETTTKRYGALLAEAAHGGHDNMFKDIVSMLQTGVVRRGGARHLLFEHKKGQIELAIKAVADDPSGRGTLFTLALASGKVESIYCVRELIGKVLSDPFEIWHQLCGCGTRMNSLSLATSVSASVSDGGIFFEAVYELLEEAAKTAYKDSEVANDALLDLFIPKPNELTKTVDTPLVRAMSSNDVTLFKRVCAKLKHLNGGTVTLKQVGDQIPARFQFGMQGADVNTRLFNVKVGDVSPPMLIEIMKAIREAERSKDATAQREEELNLYRSMRSLVQVAAERGAFDLFRVLAYSDERLHLESIPILLERIGDYKENIVDAIMLSVICARNPFTTSAEVSRYIQKAEVDLPMHKDGLRHLQEEIDALVHEVLRVLPHTIKGLGEAFAAHEYTLVRLKSDVNLQRRYDQMATKIGYAIVVSKDIRRILEPMTVLKRINDRADPGKSEGIITIDPLQHALDRGSKALDFINSPLVLDYLRLKFARSTPSWLSSDPFDNNASQRYYRYTHKKINAVLVQEYKETTPDLLMRILQGWELGDETGEQKSRSSKIKLPHVTLLPGLQFLLAGIIGKPSSFYDVPLIGFSYELLSYIVMVMLFVMSVLIRDSYVIPKTEIAFYVFVMGMLWREVLEFRDLIPNTAHPLDSSAHSRTPAPRMTLAITRYLFQDAWNILDASTIFLVAIAFFFRVAALREEPEHQGSNAFVTYGDSANMSEIIQLNPSAFKAQVLLASTAPLLFARILSLSQIDSTLGPMTQIIWRMFSHIARFSVFIVVLITSFALTFNVLLGGCEFGNKAYATLPDAHLTMFKAMLGDFNFEDIMGSNDCKYPYLTNKVATVLLVLYLVIVAILLMNLLIAVLSTVHAEVYKNTEREFHLARANLIQQSWRSRHQGRQPPPINLLRPLAGFMGDLAFEVYGMIRFRSQRSPTSQTKEWKSAIAMIHRTIFSLVMGPVAGAILTILWAVSVPWVAWNFLRWVSRNITNVRTLPEKRQSWHEMLSGGYVRLLCAIIVSSLCWTIALVPATLLSISYGVLTLPLWCYGVLGLWQWRGVNSNEFQTAALGCPEDIVSDMNGSPDDKSPHFRVDYLIKMTTGLDLEDITRLIKCKKIALRRHTPDSDEGMVDGLERELIAWKELAHSHAANRKTFRGTLASPSST